MAKHHPKNQLPRGKEENASKNSIKALWKKTWNFIWNDDSAASWIANIILAFIIIKFIVYPLLALAFGTSLPIVAVVSGSMQHEGTFDQWWASQATCSHLRPCMQSEWYAEHNITKEDFQTYTLHNGFNKGDIILLKGAKKKPIALGDILVYDSRGKSMPIIHRVVAIHTFNISTNDTETIYESKGDHNPYQINDGALNEHEVLPSTVRGKAFAKIPYVGYLKIWFSQLLRG